MSGSFWSRYWHAQFSQNVADRAAYFAKAAALIYLFREHVCELTVCVGPSMLPTFSIRGDVAVVEHLSVWSERLQVGDVVIARSVQNPRHVVCKRLLGLEGDVVQVPPASSFSPTKKITVPQGHVWLQGDNFSNSTDSRHYGPVPYAVLRGRVVCKIWPPWDIGWIERQPPPWYSGEKEKN